jgi:hypothetical protein
MIREPTRRFLNDCGAGRRRFKPHAYGGGPFGVMAAAFRCGLNVLRPLASKTCAKAAHASLAGDLDLIAEERALHCDSGEGLREMLVSDNWSHRRSGGRPDR